MRVGVYHLFKEVDMLAQAIRRTIRLNRPRPPSVGSARQVLRADDAGGAPMTPSFTARP
jgi:hypothetical protein